MKQPLKIGPWIEQYGILKTVSNVMCEGDEYYDQRYSYI